MRTLFSGFAPILTINIPTQPNFRNRRRGNGSRTLNKLEACAHCEWEQMNLRSSLARNAGKQNAPFWILTAESRQSFWLYFHPVDTCNNCEEFEIIRWALALIGGPGSLGGRQGWVARSQDSAEVSVFHERVSARMPRRWVVTTSCLCTSW